MKRLIVAAAVALSCGGPREPNRAKRPPALWIHRTLVVGRARADASLDELRLAVDGDRATLVETQKRAPQLGIQAQPAALAFREMGRTTFRGTARISDHALDLELSGDSGEKTMHCTYERRRVASASAVRVRDPSYESECGNRGVWMPSEEVEVDALVCLFEPEAVGSDARPIAFGRAPGIELLGVSEGCFIQGEAERLVPDDGSLAPALASDSRR